VDVVADVVAGLADPDADVKICYCERGIEHWDVMRRMSEAIFRGGEAPQAALDTAWKEMEALAVV
jgi:hypothetical protein